MRHFIAIILATTVMSCDGQTVYTKEEFLQTITGEHNTEDSALLDQEDKVFGLCLGVPPSTLEQSDNKTKQIASKCLKLLPEKFDLMDQAVQEKLELFGQCTDTEAAKQLNVSEDEYIRCLDQIDPEIPIEERMEYASSEEERRELEKLGELE